MPPAHPPPLSLPDYIGPVVGAAVFVLLMGLVKEPARRTFNAVIVAGATGTYISGGGFGAWDLLHHLWGGPIWPFMPTSSFGCLIFDSLIAIWFLMGAPSLRDAIQEASRHRRLATPP